MKTRWLRVAGTAVALLAASGLQNGLWSPIIGEASTVASYQFSPQPPMEPNGTRGSNGSVQVKALDGDGVPMPGANVFLTLTDDATTGGGTGSVSCATSAGGQPSSHNLSATATSCFTASDGTVTVSYQSPGTKPTTGIEDVLAVSDTQTMQDNPAFDWFKYSTVTAYNFKVGSTVTPFVAPAGSNPGPQCITFTALNAEATKETAYLSLTTPTGSTAQATVLASAPCPPSPPGTPPVGTPLSSSPTPIMLTGGTATIYYQPGSGTSGTDVIAAQDLPPGSQDPGASAIKSNIVYAHGSPKATSSDNAPIASPGSLSGSKAFNLTVSDSTSSVNPLPYGEVDLALNSLAATTGNPYTASGAPLGTASATCTNTDGTTSPVPITATPSHCVANGSGKIPVTYTRKASTTSGTDVLSSLTMNTPSVIGSTAYSHGAVAGYAFTVDHYKNGSTVAPGAGSWSPSFTLAGTTTNLYATALDASAIPVAVSSISVAFTPASATTVATLCANVSPGCSSNNVTTQAPYSTGGGVAGFEVNLQYVVSPDATGGHDVVTASNADGSLPSTDTHGYGDLLSITFQNGGTAPAPNNIYPTGELAPGQIVHFSATGLKSGGHVDTGEPLYFSLTTTAASHGTVTCTASGGGTATLTATPTLCEYDVNSSTIPLTYTAPAAPLPGSGTDTLTAQDAASNPSVTAQDTYSFTKTASYSWSPSTQIATGGSLAAGQSAPAVTLTALDSRGHAVPNTTVYVFLFGGSGSSPAAPAGSATAQGGTASPPAAGQCAASLSGSASPVLCTTDGSGTLNLIYKAPNPLPLGGRDALRAQPTSSSPAFTSADLPYDFTTLDHYGFSPSPMAFAGALTGSSPTSGETVTAKALDATGNPIAGTTVYLSFTGQSGAIATVTNGSTGGTCSGSNPTLGASGLACTTDASGSVPVTYHWSAVATSGLDVLTASSSSGSGAAVTTTDSYNYAVPKAYKFTPSPIAQPGTIGTATSTAAAVTVLDGTTNTANPISYARVYLSLNNPGGGAATVPSGQCAGTATNGRVSLSSTAVACITDSSGTVPISYVTPSTLPSTSSGIVTDTVKAASDTTNAPAISANDTYTFNAPTALVFSPQPIAPSGTLTSGTAGPVTLTVEDAAGHGIPNASPQLKFSSATATTPGTATVPGAQCGSSSAVSLSGSATTCATDGNGQVVVTYTPGNATSGTDQLTATLGNPSLAASDTYTYTQVAAYTLAPTPIASSGSMAPSGTQVVQLTSNDSHGTAVPNGSVFLSFTGPNSGPGIGAATVPAGPCGTTTTLTATPVSCTTDNTGHIAVTYTAASSPPTAGGVDTITAQDKASSPTITVPDTYTYLTVANYAFSNNGTIANQGTLGSGGHTTFSITVQDTHANSVPYSPVTLAIGADHSNPAHGSAYVTNPDHTTTPIPSSGTVTVKADSTGVVNVTYTAPATQPANGFDSICAANGSSNPTVVNCAVYAFPTVTGFSFSPNPIAPAGSLAPSTTVPVTMTTNANTGADPNTQVFVIFQQAAGGGSMTSSQCSPTTLGSSAVACVTDGNGQIAFTYTSPAQTPTSGTDQLIAQDAASSPTVTGTDAYVVQGLGYYMVASDGGIFPFGSARFHSYGSTGGMHLNQPIVGMALTPTSNGYYLVATDGGIFPFGDALQHSYGSTGNIHLNKPIVGMAVRPDFNGYYLVASDGGIFPFGPSATAHSYGSTGNIHLNQPIVGMQMTASGNGYWLVAADGGIFPFGDAVNHSYGSTGNMHLNQPIVGMARTASGNGYYLVASDGGLFPFGDALQHSYGSTGSMHLNQPIVGMAVMPDGNGYYLVASDGGLFPFGSALNYSYGSLGGTHLNQPVVGMAITPYS